MDKENLNIDYNAYAEEMRKKAIENEKFVRFEVVASTDEKSNDDGLVYARIDGKHFSTIDLLKILMSAQELINREIEKTPELKFLWKIKDKFLDTSTYKIIEDKNGNNKLKKE